MGISEEWWVHLYIPAGKPTHSALVVVMQRYVQLYDLENEKWSLLLCLLK